MTVHRTMPSEIEPDSLADLVADCSALPARLQPRPRTIDLAAVPHPRREVRVPALTAAVASGIADGYADYFV